LPSRRTEAAIDIYLLDLGSGLTPPKVLDAIRGPGDQVHPAFAKDGQRLAYASNEDGDWEIFVNSLDGLNKRQLTFNTAWDSFPAWGPDGGHLIFTSDRNGNYDLYSIDVASGIEQRLTANVASDAFPACSPDESRIAFASARSGLLEIYVANASQIEASLVRLTDSTNAPQPNRYPDWSPDGGWIVFASWRDGQAELYVMKADGSNLTRLTNSPGDDELPAWSQ
jgi:Tol biopolymer transport system component